MPLYVMAPATAPPGLVTVKVEALIEAGLIAMLNVALTVVLTATLIAPCAGVIDTTLGMTAVYLPQPAAKETRIAAIKHTNPTLFLRICYLLSNWVGAISSTRHCAGLDRTACAA
jgi:hypothetical protein